MKTWGSLLWIERRNKKKKNFRFLQWKWPWTLPPPLKDTKIKKEKRKENKKELLMLLLNILKEQLEDALCWENFKISKKNDWNEIVQRLRLKRIQIHRVIILQIMMISFFICQRRIQKQRPVLLFWDVSGCRWEIANNLAILWRYSWIE